MNLRLAIAVIRRRRRLAGIALDRNRRPSATACRRRHSKKRSSTSSPAPSRASSPSAARRRQQLAIPDRRSGDVFVELRDNAAGADAPLTVGAGVIIDRAGLVLTQYLAVREGDQHTVTTIDGKTYPATIRAADPRSGLAVLAIDPKASPLQRAGAPPKTIAPDSFPAISSATPPTSAKASSSSPSATRTPSKPTANRPPAGASSPTSPAKRPPAPTSTTPPARPATIARRSTTSARSFKPTPSSAGAPAAAHS